MKVETDIVSFIDELIKEGYSFDIKERWNRYKYLIKTGKMRFANERVERKT